MLVMEGKKDTLTKKLVILFYCDLFKVLSFTLTGAGYI